ncbi:MAG: AAA family ATPase [Acidimicrobiia bacterium]
MDDTSPFEPTVLGAMWKYKWVAILIVVATTGSAVTYALLSPLSYQAVSTLVIEDPRATSLFDIGNVQNPQRYVADQAAILSSVTVAERADKVDPTLGGPEPILDGLEVILDTTSNVIDVVFTADTPERAVASANAVTSAYAGIRTENASASFTAALDQLDNSIRDVEDQIDGLQNLIEAALGEDAPTDALGAQLSQSLARLVLLQDELPGATGTQLVEVRGEIDDVFRQLQTSLALANLQQQNPELTLLFEEQRQTVLRKADLLQRRDELSVESQLASNGIVVSSAATFADEVGVDLGRLGAFGLIFGALIAAGATYIIALQRRTFVDRSQPQMVLGVPILAEIPEFRSERIKGEVPVRSDPTSVAAESFRFIAAALDVEAEARQSDAKGNHLADPIAPLLRIFAVVSPSLGDGKTTVTANTALALARQGKRVLVIDGDFGHQKLSNLLTGGRPHEVGLTELVEDGLPFEYVAQRIPMGDRAELDLVGRGQAQVSAPDFFRSAGVKVFFEGIHDEYDIILVDTPPLLHVAYASQLVRYADRVLIVVGHGQNVAPTEELANRLAFLDTEIVGYAYNRAPLRAAKSGSEGSLRDVLGHSHSVTPSLSGENR